MNFQLVLDQRNPFTLQKNCTPSILLKMNKTIPGEPTGKVPVLLVQRPGQAKDGVLLVLMILCKPEFCLVVSHYEEKFGSKDSLITNLWKVG